MKSKKIFPIFASVSVLIMAGSFAYYLTVFLPGKHGLELEKYKSEQIKQCGKRGWEYHRNQVSGYPHNTYYSPEFHYNFKIEKCLYSGTWIRDDSAANFIDDIDTGETLLTFASSLTDDYVLECDTCVTSSDVFKLRKRELFEGE